MTRNTGIFPDHLIKELFESGALKSERDLDSEEYRGVCSNHLRDPLVALCGCAEPIR